MLGFLFMSWESNMIPHICKSKAKKLENESLLGDDIVFPFLRNLTNKKEKKKEKKEKIKH